MRDSATAEQGRSRRKRVLLRRAAFLVRYSWGAWASRWDLGLRRLALGAVLLSAFFTLVGFVPAVEFATLAAQEHAGYDFRINGPLDSVDVRRIARLPGITGIAPMTTVTSSVTAGNGRTAENLVTYLLFEPSAQSLTWFSADLLLRGSPLSHRRSGEAVIDTAAARSLAVEVGDTVGFMVEPIASVRIRVTATVVGIYASSTPLNGSLLVGPSERTRAVARALADEAGRKGLLYSDIMVAGSDDAGLEAALHDLFGKDPDVLVESRTSVIQHIRRVNEGVLGATWPIVLPQVILSVYVLVTLKDVGEKLRHRRREMATLMALGASDRVANALLSAEVLVETSLASLLGIPLSRWVIESVIHAYVPPSAWLRMLGGLVVAVVLALVITYLWTYRTLRRHPLARSLSEEVGF